MQNKATGNVSQIKDPACSRRSRVNRSNSNHPEAGDEVSLYCGQSLGEGSNTVTCADEAANTWQKPNYL